MTFSKIIKKLTAEKKLNIKPRPYINHSVEFKPPFTVQQRTNKLSQVGLNVFFYPAEMVTGCDLLSDSGTTTMTNKQWASLHLGDEMYGSNRGYFLLIDTVQKLFGQSYFNNPDLNKPNAFIFHQGRPTENALFTQLGKIGKNLIIPSNGFFDTTEANIENNKIKTLNLMSPELKDNKSKSHFKGNIDVKRLTKVLAKLNSQIPLIYLTITNNPGGGQPVSMQNIQAVAELAHSYHIPLFFDACRFAENAWFIQRYEKGYKTIQVSKIVKQMFTLADGFTISFKKDGLVNMGGGLFIKNNGLFMKKYPKLADAITDYQILTEGNPTYGGLSGRDIMTLVEGLKTICQSEYLDYRINQVNKFGQSMLEKGLPVLTPFGGHAIYLDIDRFFKGTKMKSKDFGGIAFTALLLAGYGHRTVELGNFAFGKYNSRTGRQTFPQVNFVRFAVPRLRYEDQDLESVAEATKALYDKKDNIPPIEVVYGKELTLRHFKARFKFKNQYPF